ncbi:hypothetical protein SAZ11_21105 [Streptomyces sp. FXJ1.4098]|uniref:hypothetical protein n=1 Tax=Streptomyces sp. NPDC020845 TaxID=3365096 RepID=UPI002998AEE9|nr:hypothetical protein [Streptomyces sp. FXJ1.4098]
MTDVRSSAEQLVRVVGEWRRPGTPLVAALAEAVREAVLDGRLRTAAGCPPNAAWPPGSASAAAP